MTKTAAEVQVVEVQGIQDTGGKQTQILIVFSPLPIPDWELWLSSKEGTIVTSVDFETLNQSNKENVNAS